MARGKRGQEANLGPCVVDGCEKKARALEMCSMHYARKRRTGDVHDPGALIFGDAMRRFRNYTSFGPRWACWTWNGHKNVGGYGRLWVGDRHVPAHRWFYEQTSGAVIAEGYVPDHLCRNRACVNPDHIEVVTNRENALRGVGPTAANAKKTHCPQGHPYDDINTKWYDGRRYCKACKMARDKAVA